MFHWLLDVSLVMFICSCSESHMVSGNIENNSSAVDVSSSNVKTGFWYKTNFVRDYFQVIYNCSFILLFLSLLLILLLVLPLQLLLSGVLKKSALHGNYNA